MGDRSGCPESSAADLSTHLRFDDDDDDFRSCCKDDESYSEGDSDSDCACECECECEPNETDGEDAKVHEDDFVLDESSVKLYFKGVSFEKISESSCGFTGIGVVMERPGSSPSLRVQKKLDFYVEDSVADYLALIDGLSEALKCNVKRVLAATDSRLLHDQILLEEKFDSPLTNAFRDRIFELISALEAFKLKLVTGDELESSLHLARVAIGMVSPQGKGDEIGTAENCSICCEDRPCEMMINLKCSHRFCSHCMKTYVEEKVESKEVGIRCPEEGCNYVVSIGECKTFLPDVLYDCFERSSNLDVDGGACYSIGSCSSAEQWPWDSLDAYSDQERSQLALIQRFLTGGFSLSDHHPYQSPPHSTDSFVDAIKDIHQLPWLERFVSVITDDNYYDHYTQ